VIRVAFAAVLAALLVLPAAAQDAPRPRVEGGASASVTPLNVGEGRILRMPREVSQVLVADQAVADVQIVTPRVVYVYGRGVGQTTLHAVDARDGVVASVTLRVGRSAAAAQSDLPRRASGVTMDFVGDRLAVGGTVRDVGEALEVEAGARSYSPPGIAPLDRTRLAGSQQVSLRVRFAEVSRTDLERLGINWSVVANPGNFAFQLFTGGFLRGFDTSETFGLLGGGFRDRRTAADALIDALRREGVLTLLAEPTLTTYTGEPARFLAGGEVPIPIPVREGVIGIQYKRFGVQLDFLPVVLPGERIGLRVRPEVSEVAQGSGITIQGTSVPAFTTRFAESTVELASGQTLAIAGLFQRRTADTLDRVPLAGDVPVLGALFRSSRFQRAETELVILITPFIVEPVANPRAIATPIEAATTAVRAERGIAGFVVD
jgi:pilus assembly protein CpaC